MLIFTLKTFKEVNSIKFQSVNPMLGPLKRRIVSLSLIFSDKGNLCLT